MQIESLKAQLIEAQARHAVASTSTQEPTENSSEMKLHPEVAPQVRALSVSLFVVKIDELKMQLKENSMAKLEALSKAERLEKELTFKEAETLELRGKVSQMEGALLTQREEAELDAGHLQAVHQEQLWKHQFHLNETLRQNAALQESNESFQAQLDQQKILYEKFVATLMASEEKLERARSIVDLETQEQVKRFAADRSKWQEEKASLLEQSRVSCVARLEEAKASREAQLQDKGEQHFEGLREWREEKSSLRKASELRRTLQEMEEWSEKKEAILHEIMAARKITTENQGTMRLLLDHQTTSLQAKLDQQQHENHKIVAALTETQQELKTVRDRWKRGKGWLMKELEDSRISILSQLHSRDQEHKVENERLQTALMASEEELKTQRAQSQRGEGGHLEELEHCRNSLLAQLTMQGQERKMETEGFPASLMDLSKWEGERSTLLKASEELKLTLQNKEAVLHGESVALEAQVALLEKKIGDKNRNKWYRRLWNPVWETLR
ncbi:putative uncharacterized protein MYH16 [Cyclopterus lumpus]|uniref:putative uncharacterized protein MYH16 n=1 Tax=Cyclopterus lumpus TaxID=8103 RepID=UPI001485FD6C|nr:putative uncharacterized protein MYH16 [Cyclopterus lumpus]